MADIRIDVDHIPYDGERLVFRAPCNASSITGLKIYNGDLFTLFTLCDAHGDDIGNIDDIFETGALVTIVLDAGECKAFIQNADTNGYLEDKFAQVYNDIPTDNNQLTNGAGYITSSGSCDSADKATKDADGNVIATTYATKTELGTKQDSSTAINTSNIGSQSVASATALTSKSIGNATKPVYFNANGVPTACTYSLGKSVPSNAEFTDTTYGVATQSADGLMSSSDKTKLDGVATGANKTTVTNNLTSTSTTNALSANMGKKLNDEKLSLSGGTITGNVTINDIYGALTCNCAVAMNRGATITNITTIKNGSIRFSDANNTVLGSIENSANQNLKIMASNEANQYLTYGVRESMWSLFPYADSTRLGTPNKKWNQIYSTSGTINTSDRNLKKDIKSLDEETTKEFIMNLKPVSYKMIDGESGRTHTGLIAQDVEETLNEMNLSEKDFAGLCKDKKFVDEKETDEYIYGLRYEEFISPLLKMVQIQQKEIEDLKARVEALENK